MRHYQGVTQKFWAYDVLKNGKNNVSKSFLSQQVLCFPNAARIDEALYGVWFCEPTDVVQKWNSKSSSYLKVLKAWKYPKISELPLQKIPWKINGLKRKFVILEIINSISLLKNDEIIFVLLRKLWTVCSMPMKSIR